MANASTDDADLFGDDDFSFDDARSAFVKMDDLLGRLCLVYAFSVGERESNIKGQAGKMYEYIECDVHVLDGDVNDMIPDVPTILDGFQLSGQNVVGQLKPKIRTRRPMLGRLAKKPPSQKGLQDAWIFNEPSEEDKTKAKAYMKALAARKAKEDPFDS